jgi:hypothetical protein
MPVDRPVVNGLTLLGHTVQCIPDDIEILATAGQMQRRPALQTDKQRTCGSLWGDDPAADRYLNGLGMLAQQPSEGTQSARRAGKLQLAVVDGKTTVLVIIQRRIIAAPAIAHSLYRHPDLPRPVRSVACRYWCGRVR